MTITPPLPFVPDKPGRGAWRLTGGYLPVRPGKPGPIGYLRLAVADEVPVGSAWRTGVVTTHSANVVSLGCAVLQGLVGAKTDGWFGTDTDAAVQAAQERLGVTVDGIVGQATMRALLAPKITAVADQRSVPVRILGGLLVLESGLDPAAVGTNGTDTGVAQINLDAHREISLTQALDPQYAIRWSADQLRATYDTWAGRTAADPWDVAIAHHNSPLLAREWAVRGVAPVDPSRSVQIADYVAKVRAAW